MIGKEIELKLALTPEALTRLKKSAFLKDHKRGRAKVQSQHSVYFDTPDWAVRNHGLVLRVRHLGRRRLQTLKTLPDAPSALFEREEREQEIASDFPDLSPFAKSDLAPLFGDPQLAGRLSPLFATDVRRAIYILGGRDWQVELALDEGKVESDGASEPICEAELELKEGRPAKLFELAMALQNEVPMRLATASKSDRGYRLLARNRPAPTKAKPLALASGSSVAETVKSIGRACLSHLLANVEPLLTDSAPEAVHQLRVAMRRLRSALALFDAIVEGPGAERAVGELKWLTDKMGPARDLDVFLADILGPVLKAFPDDGDLASLASDFAGQRASLYATAHEALASDRFTRAMLEIRAWIEDGDWLEGEAAHKESLAAPIESFAHRLLDRLWRKAAKLGDRFETLPPADLHRLRIRIKKLRYACEFFHSLYGAKKARRFIVRLSSLQDDLGVLNDIEVARRRLGESGIENGESGRHRAIGAVIGWHSARAEPLLAKAAEDWRALAKQERFWNE